ncbi:MULTISPECIES: TRAP transporter substrate-binding protein [Pseudovibrio]|uniref:TRAP transporter substrate-binding protein n=1 Tax=Stappiaceae TaxID=2821832 RepID=UPI0023655757|nr:MULTISPECIES: TRAP transporter substrate-binding protein [Pseudovibrio]MDD7911265.1 TRAP transporter substrate-binding protein [Pseudovibrio exalbescens]MDX5593048.1 TRAP transporter substrate-binding protein [Pseudovibrio sp. SPO723]
MNRRRFLKTAGAMVGAGAVAAPLAAPAQVMNRRQLSMVTCWPRTLPGFSVAAGRIAERINAGSGGRFEVNVYPAGELVPAFEAFDAVSSGAAELYHASDDYWNGNHKAFSFFGGVPGGMTHTEYQAWIHWGGGQELWDEVAGQFDIKPFMAGHTTHTVGGWFSRDIETVNDLRGFKMMLPGLAGEVLRRLGGMAITIPANEIRTALKSGGLDGADWAGPWAAMGLGLHEVTKYCAYPGFNGSGIACSMGVNLNFWRSLTPEDQLLFASAAHAENDLLAAEFTWQNAVALQSLQEDKKFPVRPLPQEVQEAFMDTCEDVMMGYAGQDGLTERVYQGYKSAQARLVNLSRVAQEPFSALRNSSTET